MDVNKTLKNLMQNNIKSFTVNKREEVVPFLKRILPTQSKVACGGSLTLQECGVTELLASGDYINYTREMTGYTAEEIFALQNTSDYYFTSANAITENGIIYNVDGRGNRVGAIANGPKNIIIIAGVNKLVKDINEAIYRVKTIAAPKNCIRLNYKTYCSTKGHCQSIDNDLEKQEMAAGCNSPDRICCQYLITGYQKIKNRIIVLLVKETLGY